MHLEMLGLLTAAALIESEWSRRISRISPKYVGLSNGSFDLNHPMFGAYLHAVYFWDKSGLL